MSSNVVALVETVVEYVVEHLGRKMAATTVETARRTLRRIYRARLSMTAWRGYANLLLDKDEVCWHKLGSPQQSPD